MRAQHRGASTVRLTTPAPLVQSITLMQTEWILAYLALGAVVGFMAGLLGIGGGGIMVPTLASLFAAQGVPHEHLVHMALGTSMAAIVVTAVSSVREHQKHKAILWPVVWKMVPGILIGTFAATCIATRLPSKALGIFFACFMSYVALQMVLDIKPKAHRELPGTAALGGVGAGIGAISALVAIGGGALTVPFLTWCNVSIRKAIATSAAVGLPIAIAGALGYLLNGLGAESRPAHSVGYISLPAMLAISIVSYLTAPFGARLTHRLPVKLLKRVFAVLLVALSLKMLTTVL